MDGAFLTLEEAARVAGHARWLEDRLFSVTGEWVAVEDDPAAKAVFSAHSLRHAWHASVWSDRIPRVAHLEPDALTAPAGPDVSAFVNGLAAATRKGADGTRERMTLLGALLRGLVADYRERVARAHPLADGPTVRWLGFVLADEIAALDEIDAVLAECPPGPELRRPPLERGALLGVASPIGI
ncbi:MAG TPA: hypothetical protein VE760_07335 [Acidimicrobiales bacterium]|nr:hypothetical protein [Acidimicrobiales bacterium]